MTDCSDLGEGWLASTNHHLDTLVHGVLFDAVSEVDE